MENSDPRRYREAAVALELQDLENSTYRALLSRGRIARRVRRLVGGKTNGTSEDRFWIGTRPIDSAMT